MLGQPRIRLSELAGFCRRLSVATAAGVDPRTVWQREAERGPAGGRRYLAILRDGVAAGESVGDALARTGNYFPQLLHEMVRVGEHTGKEAEIYAQLAEHYQHQLKMKRLLGVSLVWPGIQLTVAIFVVGLLIWVPGVIGGAGPGGPIDLLGLGLLGNSGLMIYLGFLAAVAFLGWLVYQSARRGAAWTRPFRRIALRIPGIGYYLRTSALARLTWILHLALDVGMDLRRALPMALSAMGRDSYIQHADHVVRDVTAGCEIYEAFQRTGAIEQELLDTIEVAEASGSMAESMGHAARQYEEKAQNALKMLNVGGGFAIWLLVALVIILLIFRMAMFYIGTIYDALEY